MAVHGVCPPPRRACAAPARGSRSHGSVRMCKKETELGQPIRRRVRGLTRSQPRQRGEKVTMAEAEPDEFMARLDPDDRPRWSSAAGNGGGHAGASLFLEGESCSTVVIVVSGRVKVFSLTEQGEEIVLAVRGPGALLGELSAVDGGAAQRVGGRAGAGGGAGRADRRVHRLPARARGGRNRAAADGHRQAARLRPQARRVRRLRHRGPGGPAAGGAGRPVRRARRAGGADLGGAVPGRAGRLGRGLPGGGGQGAAGVARPAGS